MNELLDIFQIEKTCEYRGEVYRVRDNGAIYRCRKPDKRKRPLDEKWTFGNPNKRTGYMNISSESVHRIVATAFHGQQPSDKHIVDHIDTNKRNNRPENLRWLTRLENILFNPITHSRIIYKYGSIDNFLSNPSEPLNGSLDQNFEWMRTVTKEESENTKNNLLNMGREGKITRSSALGEWIFLQLYPNNYEVPARNEIVQSLTKNAVQKNWRTPSEFPLCPEVIEANVLAEYCQRLERRKVFAIDKYKQSLVYTAKVSESSDALLIICHRPDEVKDWALAKVFIEDQKFVHESLGTFFQLKGAEKELTIALGLEWDGGESFDELVG